MPLVLRIHQGVNPVVISEPSWSSHFPKANQLTTKPQMRESMMPMASASYPSHSTTWVISSWEWILHSLEILTLYLFVLISVKTSLIHQTETPLIVKVFLTSLMVAKLALCMHTYFLTSLSAAWGITMPPVLASHTPKYTWVAAALLSALSS